MPATDENPLSSILPESIRAAIGDPPYFSITTPEGVQPPVRLSRNGHGDCYEFGDTDLVAQFGIGIDTAHRAAIQSLVLVNEADRPSPPIRELSTIHFSLEGDARVRPELHWINGGLTHHFYPPIAYRGNALSFGVPLTGGTYAITSGSDGRSSSQDLPILQVLWAGEHERSGFWAALEWSGMWQLGIRREHRTWWFFGGPQVNDLVLEPGEALALPATHIGFFDGGVDDGCNSARRYVYDRICPDYDGRRPLPPISYDHWCGVSEQISETFMMKQADACAELGMEFFVVDAGWFASSGTSFSEGVGNWERVAPDKFPSGLEPVADYVREKGMKFGLWFEVERAHRSSDWVRQHPSWFFPTSGEAMHLDLTQEEVQDAVIDLIDAWIRRLDVRWSRWDYNITPKPYWDTVDPSGKVQFAYMRGLYRILDTLIQRHPQWLVECCSSGGNRTDFGMLRRAHAIWFSDHSNEPHICRLMQTGAARYLPGHLTNSSVAVSLGEGDWRFDDTAVLSRMAGAFSIDGDVASWSSKRREEVRGLIDVYRDYRHLLVKDFYPLTPYPRSIDDWDVVQFAHPSTTESVVLAYRVAGDTDERLVFPKRLRPDSMYDVLSPLEGASATASGSELMCAGLRLTLPHDAATVRRLVPRRAG